MVTTAAVADAQPGCGVYVRYGREDSVGELSDDLFVERVEPGDGYWADVHLLVRPNGPADDAYRSGKQRSGEQRDLQSGEPVVGAHIFRDVRVADLQQPEPDDDAGGGVGYDHVHVP